MPISEEIRNKIIKLYCNTVKRTKTIYKEVAPNGEITYEDMYSIIEECNEKSNNKLKRIERECSEDEVLELLENGLNKKEIAAKLEVRLTTISLIIQNMIERGVEIPKNKKTENDEKDNKILELLENGLNQTEIGNQLGVSSTAIWLRIQNMKKRGVKIPKITKRRKTENDEKDNKILELLGKGLSQAETGRQLGVSADVISKRIKKMRERGIKIPETTKRRKTESYEKDNKILELLENGLNQTEIAGELGVSVDAISKRIKKMRERGVIIPPKIKRRKTESYEKDNKILELLEKGLTRAEIGNQLGLSKISIKKRIKNMREQGIEIPKRIKAKTDNNKEVKNNIVAEFKEEKTELKIAKEIVNLMNTKKASAEQVRVMAEIYGVDAEVEELLQSLDEQER